MKQLIDPAAFNKSLAMAFDSNFDVESSIRRVKKIIANLPPDKLYYTNRKGWIAFYKRVDGRQKCLPKASKELYLLARRRYLLLQLEILELTGRRESGGQASREKLILEIQNLIDVFARGNLDVARIVMTPAQYKWFAGPFRKKPLNKDIAYETVGGTYVRSKSERDILNTAESLAVPAHYEEETLINVSDIIYLEAQNQYVMIYTQDDEYLVRYNIGDFEEQLKNDGFFRIHRGYLISLAKVKKLLKGEMLMENGDDEISLPVSRANVKPLKEALYSFVENSAM